MRMILDCGAPMARITTLSLVLAAVCLSPTVQAQSTNWTDVNLAVTDAVVIPAYARFAGATAALQQNAGGFCAAVSAESLAALQQHYHDAVDAYQGVQHIQFGPITYFNWNFRLQYWPDDSGTGARQLDALIAAADAGVLQGEAFGQQSVGVQGFPALERLLFAENSLDELQAQPYRCQVVQAITRNLDEIGQGVHQRWVDEFRATVANADERGFFESAEDATIDFLKSVVESLPRLQEQKLLAVLGDEQAAARGRRAESWRSDRSVRNLRLDVAALRTMFNDSTPALNSVLLPEDIAGINAGFDKLEQTLAAAPDSMNAALETPEGWAALKLAADDTDALFELLEAALKNTDLYLGFNSLDGD
jgi:predicted lipoprotein